jgi:hypothetical protein
MGVTTKIRPRGLTTFEPYSQQRAIPFSTPRHSLSRSRHHFVDHIECQCIKCMLWASLWIPWVQPCDEPEQLVASRCSSYFLL